MKPNTPRKSTTPPENIFEKPAFEFSRVPVNRAGGAGLKPCERFGLFLTVCLSGSHTTKWGSASDAAFRQKQNMPIIFTPDWYKADAVAANENNTLFTSFCQEKSNIDWVCTKVKET